MQPAALFAGTSDLGPKLDRATTGRSAAVLLEFLQLPAARFSRWRWCAKRPIRPLASQALLPGSHRRHRMACLPTSKW